MKTKILLMAALFTGVTSFAQKISFGAGAGLSRFSMRGDAVNYFEQLLDVSNGLMKAKPVTGFYAGGYVNIPLSAKISIEPGLYYSTRGYGITGTYTVKDIGFLSADASAKLQTGYIDMPVLLKADFSGLQLFAGPQLSYLTHASLNTRAAVAGINLYNSTVDVTSRFNQLDVSVTGGIGYQFANGLRLSAAYEHGLSTIDAGKNINAFNQGVKIGAAISF